MSGLKINECALLLCVIGGKIEKENKRLFPSVEQAMDYLTGNSKELKGVELYSDVKIYKEDMLNENNKEDAHMHQLRFY